MVSSFEQWFGKTVCRQLITGETRVPLRGIICGSWRCCSVSRHRGLEFDVYKSLILAVEREERPLDNRS